MREKVPQNAARPGLGGGADAAKVSYNLREVVAATGINRSAVYVAITDGSLPSFKLGRRRMISARALHEWINRLEQGVGQKQARA